MKIPGQNPLLAGTVSGTINPGKADGPNFADLVATPESLSLGASGTPDDAEGIYEAAKQFEAFFVQKLFSVMRESIPKDGLVERGYSNDVYESMLDQEYAKSITESGGIGLADMLAKQLMEAAGLEDDGSGYGAAPLDFDAAAE